MTRSRYSIQEAINRLLRALEGKTVNSDIPGGLTGEVLSENEAWSDLAELFEGSLPGETLTLPAAGLDFATAEEMYLGVSQDTVVSPYRAEFLNVYGGIYTWTGTAQLTGMSASSYTKITGAFDGSMSSYGVLLQPGWSNIGIGVYGTYMIEWNMSFYGSSDVTYSVEPYVENAGLPEAVARVTPYASGSAVNFGGVGHHYMSGTVSTSLVDLRLLPSATAWMNIDSASLIVRRVGK